MKETIMEILKEYDNVTDVKIVQNTIDPLRLEVLGYSELNNIYYSDTDDNYLTIIIPDTYIIKDISELFKENKKIKIIDLGQLNGSQIENMAYLCFACDNLSELKLPDNIPFPINTTLSLFKCKNLNIIKPKKIENSINCPSGDVTTLKRLGLCP